MQSFKTNQFCLILVWIAVLTTGLLLRLDRMALPLLIEENWHLYSAASADWAEFFASAKVQAHPPLFYLPGWIALQFGIDPQLARIGPMIFGMGFIWLAGLVVSRFVDDVWVGTAAGAMVAIMPIFVEISTEIRGYGLALCLLAIWLLNLIRSQPESWNFGRHLAVASLALAASMAHYGAVFAVVAAYLVWLMNYFRRSGYQPKLTVLANTMPHLMAMAVPIYMATLHSKTVVPSLDYLSGYFYQGKLSDVASIAQYFVSAHLLLLKPSGVWAVGVLLLVGICCAIFGVMRRRQYRSKLLSLLAAAVLVDLMMWGASLFGLYPFSAWRHGVFSTALTVGFAAVGLGLVFKSFSRNWFSPALVMLLLVLGWQFLKIEPPNLRRDDFDFGKFFELAGGRANGIVIDPLILAGLFAPVYDGERIKFYSDDQVPTVYRGQRFFRRSAASASEGLANCMAVDPGCWLVDYGIVGQAQPEFAGSLAFGPPQMVMSGQYDWLVIYAQLYRKS
jgi:hypothetical protein